MIGGEGNFGQRVCSLFLLGKWPKGEKETDFPPSAQTFFPRQSNKSGNSISGFAHRNLILGVKTIFSLARHFRSRPSGEKEKKKEKLTFLGGRFRNVSDGKLFSTLRFKISQFHANLILLSSESHESSSFFYFPSEVQSSTVASKKGAKREREEKKSKRERRRERPFDACLPKKKLESRWETCWG